MLSGRNTSSTLPLMNKNYVSELALQSWETGMSRFMTLIVEDDTLQREVLADVLKDNGLEVIECTTAEAAELVLASTGLELRALVTDIYLDGTMTGIELAEFAKRKFPALNVIIVSGKEFSDLPRDTLFLQKPYLPSDLLHAVLN
jgi:DNA-binding NtrC family response regulator